MVNRPRAIGTVAETAVVRVARANGFPWADRLALHGTLDVGDVTLCPGVMVEIKGGDAARNATDRDIERWLDETAIERDQARAVVGFLVVQRAHVGLVNASRWWAYWRLGWIADLDDRQWLYARAMPVRTLLGESLTMLRAAGYGEPLDES
jgi:hypothetical protein